MFPARFFMIYYRIDLSCFDVYDISPVANLSRAQYGSYTNLLQANFSINWLRQNHCELVINVPIVDVNLMKTIRVEYT